jgi:hypothetical protein
MSVRLGVQSSKVLDEEEDKLDMECRLLCYQHSIGDFGKLTGMLDRRATKYPQHYRIHPSTHRTQFSTKNGTTASTKPAGDSSAK